MPREVNFACSPCRSSKRRCDKIRPCCGLCLKKGIECTYASHQSDPTTTNHAGDIQSPQHEVSTVAVSNTSELQPLRFEATTQSSALIASFLDCDLFLLTNREQQALSWPYGTAFDVHPENGFVVHSIASTYFRTVHTWMPIVSRHLFYQNLLNPLIGRTTDFYLMLLSMKLVISKPRSIEPDLYKTTKKFLTEIVERGHLTLCAVQASILVAIYEIGHAIYPAASFSIGFCTRLATTLGIDRTIHVDQEPWLDIQEARRCWWSILVLDRFVAFGSYGRALVTPCPELTSILPCDDQIWDEKGPSSRHLPLFSLGSASTLQLGRFARLAQSTRLLDQTIHLIASPTSQSTDSQEQAAQLRRTIMSLCHLYRLEESERRLEYCTQSAVCFSAIFLLSQQLNRESTDTTASTGTTPSIESDSAITSIKEMIPRLLASDVSCLSPFLIHAIYKSAIAQINYEISPPSVEQLDYFQDLKATLVHLSQRWDTAGAYLEILRAVENTVPEPASVGTV